MSRTDTFETRLRRLGRRHAQMYRNGIVARMGRDGLITPYPRRRTPRFPLRGVAILFIAALLYKAFLLAWLGLGTYTGRVEGLAQGNPFEKAGAWVMQADPATRLVADLLSRAIPGL